MFDFALNVLHKEFFYSDKAVKWWVVFGWVLHLDLVEMGPPTRLKGVRAPLQIIVAGPYL